MTSWPYTALCCDWLAGWWLLSKSDTAATNDTNEKEPCPITLPDNTPARSPLYRFHFTIHVSVHVCVCVCVRPREIEGGR